MYLWTPVMAGFDGLINVQEKWSINDLADAHEALEIKAEMEQFYRKRLNGTP